MIEQVIKRMRSKTVMSTSDKHNHKKHRKVWIIDFVLPEASPRIIDLENRPDSPCEKYQIQKI